jgi:hypothetical protein
MSVIPSLMGVFTSPIESFSIDFGSQIIIRDRKFGKFFPSNLCKRVVRGMLQILLLLTSKTGQYGQVVKFANRSSSLELGDKGL